MAAKKTAKPAKKPAARKSKTPKIDPLNRKQYTSVTPVLTVRDVGRAVDFYTRAFGFAQRAIMKGPGDAILHAELQLRDTTVMLSPESAEQHSFGAHSIGGTPVTLYVLVENVDSTFDTAVGAGGQVLMPVMDMFWGDRCCLIGDPEGNKWMIATHKAEPTPEEMREAMKAQMEPQPEGLSASAAAGSGSY
jgi:PhnB protein